MTRDYTHLAVISTLGSYNLVMVFLCSGWLGRHILVVACTGSTMPETVQFVVALGVLSSSMTPLGSQWHMDWYWGLDFMALQTSVLQRGTFRL